MNNRVLFVGDLHCKQEYVLPYVSKLVESQNVNKVVFLGDYVDDWNVPDKYVIKALDAQVEWYKKWSDKVDVVNLCGNHDWSYLHKDKYVASGHRYDIERSVKYRLNKLNLQMSCVVDKYLVTHAGVTKEWLDYALPDVNVSDTHTLSDTLNLMYSNGDSLLNDCGPSRGGKDVAGPLWCDAYEDLKNVQGFGTSQIVGHSPVSCVCCNTNKDGTVTYVCDTMSLTRQGTPIGNSSMLLLDFESDAVLLPSIERWDKIATSYHSYVTSLLFNDVVSTFKTEDVSQLWDF